MAIRLKFDSNGNALQPTLVLMTKSGRKLGQLPATNTQFRDAFNTYSEGRFDVYGVDTNPDLWNKIVDLKLVWAREWNNVYELTHATEDSDGELRKICTLKSLGESELSQINLYEVEINTEDDIARDDYEPTILFNEDNPKASMLHRILEKAPHYTIAHVDSRLANIQRSFSWDNTSIYDAMMEIAEEYNCLFRFNCYLDGEGKLRREISIYDLESYCTDCGSRGDFIDTCDECGGHNILPGYGEDTTIFITSENLADTIELQADVSSVKNVMKLVAGDDLMTAAIISCNPNGSPYIWHLSNLVRSDMSDELVAKLEDYNELYDEYQNSHVYDIDSTVKTNYNNLITKYSSYTTDYPSIDTITGYPALMELNYQSIGFYYYLSHSFMPTPSTESTTASTECTKLQTTLNSVYSFSIATRNEASLNSLSVSTANSMITQLARTIVSSAYKVTISGNPTLSNNKVWSGTVQLVNYSDEEDTSTVSLSLTFNSDYETYVKQCLDHTLHGKDVDEMGITALFRMNNTNFANELKKYGLASLRSLYDACQSCVDVLIQQGIADGQTWSGTLYESMYSNGYYYKLGLIESELQLRETEIGYIQAVMDAIDEHRNTTHDVLDFEDYLGETLWLEFVAYRREDVYQNDNYISDGLTDAELFANALEFVKTATKELYRAAELQHSITATVKNLLAMKEFLPIIDYFEVGNWLRVKIDGVIYKLRLLDYQVNFDDLDNLMVTFSDVSEMPNSINDIKKILSESQSMASSYDSVKRQANKGESAYYVKENWVSDGLDLTNMKIVNNADNQDVVWDEHGILCREYSAITGSYDPAQLKIINHGLYVTDDNWATAKAGIGKFMLWNPVSQKNEEHYGLIADTVVGHLILGEKMYIANSANTFSVTTDGMSLTNGTNTFSVNLNNTYMIDVLKGNTHVMYLDAEGNLNITGNITATSGSFTGTVTAGSGAIGGFAIETNSIHTQNVEVTSNANNSVALSSSTFTRTINGTSRSSLKLAIGANFGVNNSGVLYAGSAIISGAITATSGTIGAANATNKITIGTNATHASIYYGMSSLGNTSSNGFYIGTDGIALGKGLFKVTSAGALTATSATIAGDITANTGKIGGANGWTIDTNKIYSGTYGSSSSMYLGTANLGSATIADTTLTTWRFTIGANFGVTNGGALYAKGANISGVITANTGKIGGTNGWTIDTNKIYSGTYGSSSSMYLGTANLGTATIAEKELSTWRFTIGANFGVTNGGALYAKGANVSGVITATQGEIGGWTIGTNSLSHGTWGSANGMMLCSTGTSTKKSIGGSSSINGWTFTSGATFGVTNSGSLYASKAIISGNITATQGKIGGWTISSNSIYREVTSSGTNYKMILNAPASINASTEALRVTGGSVTIEDTAWHYYGDWEWTDYPNAMIYKVEKDDGTIGYAYGSGNYDSSDPSQDKWYDTWEQAGNGTWYGGAYWIQSVLNNQESASMRGNHATTSSTSYTKILYDGSLWAWHIHYKELQNESDRRLKTNIENIDIELAAEFIYSQTPVKFNYSDDLNSLHHGLIAQDVKLSKLYDEWSLVSEDYRGYYSLNYIEMISDLIATAQSQNNRITQLNNRITQLENAIEQLLQARN